MTKSPIISLPKISLFLLLICITHLSAQPNQLISIVINGTPLSVDKESNWLRKPSIVKILGNDNVQKLALNVTPDSGWIDVTPFECLPIKITIDNFPQDSLFIQLSLKIRKYKVGLKQDDNSEKEIVFIRVKLGGKLELDAIDLLLVPLAYKLSVLSYSWIFPKKHTIEILQADRN